MILGILIINSENENEYVRIWGNKNEKKNILKNWNILKNSFRGLKCYDLELKRLRISDHSNDNVKSSSSKKKKIIM